MGRSAPPHDLDGWGVAYGTETYYSLALLSTGHHRWKAAKRIGRIGSWRVAWYRPPKSWACRCRRCWHSASPRRPTGSLSRVCRRGGSRPGALMHNSNGGRTEKRSVGKEWVRKVRPRWEAES